MSITTEKLSESIGSLVEEIENSGINITNEEMYTMCESIEILGANSITVQNPAFEEFDFSVLEKLIIRHKEQFYSGIYRHFTLGEALDVLRELGVTTERINSRTQIVRTDFKTFYIVLRFSEFYWYVYEGIKTTPEAYENSFLLEMENTASNLNVNLEDLKIISKKVVEKNRRLLSTSKDII